MKYINEMEDYLYNHNYISESKYKSPLRQQELSIERASCIAEKYRTLTEEKDKEIERLNNIINEIKKLDLYISEEDYDYEENPIDKYIPFDIEDYIKELKGDSSNE